MDHDCHFCEVLAVVRVTVNSAASFYLCGSHMNEWFEHRDTEAVRVMTFAQKHNVVPATKKGASDGR